MFRTASGVWKLGDFGSSLRVGDERLLARQVLKLEGTFSFAAPEYISIWSAFTKAQLTAATSFKVGVFVGWVGSSARGRRLAAIGLVWACQPHCGLEVNLPLGVQFRVRSSCVKSTAGPAEHHSSGWYAFQFAAAAAGGAARRCVAGWRCSRPRVCIDRMRCRMLLFTCTWKHAPRSLATCREARARSLVVTPVPLCASRQHHLPGKHRCASLIAACCSLTVGAWARWRTTCCVGARPLLSVRTSAGTMRSTPYSTRCAAARGAALRRLASLLALVCWVATTQFMQRRYRILHVTAHSELGIRLLPGWQAARAAADRVGGYSLVLRVAVRDQLCRRAV